MNGGASPAVLLLSVVVIVSRFPRPCPGATLVRVLRPAPHSRLLTFRTPTVGGTDRLWEHQS